MCRNTRGQSKITDTRGQSKITPILSIGPNSCNFTLTPYICGNFTLTPHIPYIYGY